MRGRAKFKAAGTEQDEHLVRQDYNTARMVGDVRYGKYFVFFMEVKKWIYLDYHDVVWAYRRLEDVHATSTKENPELEVHSLMFVTKDKKRLGILVGEKENAIIGLQILQENNAFADIGFSREKEEQYL